MDTTVKRKKKTDTNDISNPVGRPPKFQNPEELQSLIDDYFQSCQNENGRFIKPLTITGLALAIDTNRQTLLEYEKKNDQFADTIKRAKLRIENYAEEQLFTNRNTAGVIFNMVNNYGWQNRQDSNLNHSGEAGVRILNDIPRRTGK